MRKRYRSMLAAVFLGCGTGLFAGASAAPLLQQPQETDAESSRRVLLVHSYHPAYEWTASITRGVRQGLPAHGIDLQIVYMDAKRNPDPDDARARGAEALRVVEEWRPEVVIAADDNAQQWFARYLAGMERPQVVFVGVNGEAADYGYPAGNVTGVLERPHVVASVELLRRFVPGAQRIAVINDESPTAKRALERLTAEMRTEFDVVSLETPADFAAWRLAVERAREQADAIAVYTYQTVRRSAGDRQSMPAAEVMRWTAGHSGLPVVGFLGYAAADAQLILGCTDVPEHENAYPGMPTLYFYNIPVIGGNRVAGMPVLYLAPETKADAEMHGFMQAVSDVLSSAMQRLSMERHLEEARASAEAASAAKSRFLANMSHEIRTPLNGVLGMAQLLDESPLDTEQRGYLQAIDRCGRTLLGIMMRILDFSELDGSGVRLRAEPLDLRSMLREAVDQHEGRARERGLELVLQISPACPDAVYGDRARLRQLLEILLDNALKFTERGSIRAELAAARGNGDMQPLQLAVRDTGIGIPADRQADLFRAFTEADESDTRLYAGAGLGLALAKRIVELMGGSMAVRSEQGRGARFAARFALLVVRPVQRSPATLA